MTDSSTTTSGTRDVSAQSSLHTIKRTPDGSFLRPVSVFRDFVQPGSRFPPAHGRYHLYVSPACPWAHRAMVVRELKGLQEIIPITRVSPRMGSSGWPFAPAESDPFPGAEADPIMNAQHIRDIYLASDPNYTGRFTVPVLYDTKLRTIVNNESSEIIRMFNAAFNDFLPQKYAAVDLYPPALRTEIDKVNDMMYETINNGVYKCGIANTQSAYESAFTTLFAALDSLEARLASSPSAPFLLGNTLTESDIRLYTTLIRFDPVYFHLFKCNLRSIRVDYPALHTWLRRLYWKDAAFNGTTDFAHIKTHYFWSLHTLNPTRIVPVGPEHNVLPL